MGWDNIIGDSSILPRSNGGQDEIKFESGKAKKIRLILPNGSEPYSYLEHCLEVETVENGQMVRTFRTIRCPKTTQNPNASCPLCDGQQVRRRVRHACNVFDYDLGKIQKLNAGEQTTVTKKTRRVFEMNWERLRYVTQLNRPTAIALNFAQYIDWGAYKCTDPNKLSQKVWDFINKVQEVTGVPVKLIGTGAGNDDIINLM